MVFNNKITIFTIITKMRKKYIPTYATGGGVMQDNSTQSMVDTVGSNSPWGLFYSAGKAVDKAAFKKDPVTGAYKNEAQAMLSHGITDPAQNLAQAKKEWQEGDKKRAAISMVALSMAGKYYQEDALEAQEELRQEGITQQLTTNRLETEALKPQMQFKSGGYIPTFPNGGSLTPAQTVRENYRPQSYQTQQDGDFNKADYGDLLRSTPLYSPSKPDSLVAVENYYKGVPGAQYMQPGQSTGSRMESYQAGDTTRFAGSEKPQFANGGYMEETRNNPDITYYANGGTHGENPNGGIPIGNKGLVEEDEVRYKDYIFTNRY